MSIVQCLEGTLSTSTQEDGDSTCSPKETRPNGVREKAVGKTGLVDIEGNVSNETRTSNPCQMGTEVPLKNHSGMIEKQD